MTRKYEISLFKSLEMTKGISDILKNPKKYENAYLDEAIHRVRGLIGIITNQLNRLPNYSFENEITDNLIKAVNNVDRMLYLKNLKTKFNFDISEYTENPYKKGVNDVRRLFCNYLICSNKLQQYILSVIEKNEKLINEITK